MPIGSMGLVYLPTWMVEIDGECSMDVPYMDPVGYEGGFWLKHITLAFVEHMIMLSLSVFTCRKYPGEASWSVSRWCRWKVGMNYFPDGSLKYDIIYKSPSSLNENKSPGNPRPSYLVRLCRQQLWSKLIPRPSRFNGWSNAWWKGDAENSVTIGRGILFRTCGNVQTCDDPLCSLLHSAVVVLGCGLKRVPLNTEESRVWLEH